MSNQGRYNEVSGAVELPSWWDDATMKLVDKEEAKVLLALGVAVWWDAATNFKGDMLGWCSCGFNCLVDDSDFEDLTRHWKDPIFYVKKGEKLDD